MSIEKIYKTLPHDNSGSIAKNRFGYEMAIGLEKMMEYYAKNDDYIIVFDYVCDIEIHNEDDNKLIFYQVKTSEAKKTFNTTYITGKGNKQNSIVGTLFKLFIEDNKDSISLVIVGNLPFKDGDNIIKYTDLYSFSRMSDDTNSKILNQLKDEKIINKDIELNNFFYSYCPMNTETYDETMLGKLIKFYTDNIAADIKKPKTLYDTLKSVIVSKAKNEMQNGSYEDIISSKGIRKKEFQRLLNLHKQKGNEIIKKCVSRFEINNRDNIAGAYKIKGALCQIINSSNNEANIILNKIESNIIEEIRNFEGNFNEFVDYYIEKYDDIFSIDNDYYEKYAYILYEYTKKLEE